MKDNNKRNVILKFPDSNRDKFNFKLSINEAKQSNFLSDVMNCKEEHSYIIEVPSSLYQEIRDIDLKQFYFLWIGSVKLPFSELIKDGQTIHNYKSIYDLVNAFLLKEELPFVKILTELYGNNDTN